MRAPAMARDGLRLVGRLAGVGDTTQLTVTRFQKDSVSFAMQGAQLKAALGSKGEIVGGVNLGQGWTITRKP